jgi:hypothetical protein
MSTATRRILATLTLAPFAVTAMGQDITPIKLKPGKWFIDPTIDGGSKAQPYKAGGGLAFAFPESPYPDPNATHPWYGYLVRPWSAPITGSSLVITVSLIGSPVAEFNYQSESFNTCDSPAAMYPYFQSGDLYNATGGNRWWCQPSKLVLSSALNAGYVTLNVPLDPALWSDTYGRSGDTVSGFSDTLAHPTWIGVTFGGGCFFGHGVNSYNGQVELQVVDFYAAP